MFPQVGEFLEECEALHGLLAPRPDAVFELRTQFKDWSVHDVIAHLHLWNHAADLSLRDGEAFQAFWKRLAGEIVKGRSLVELTDEWLEGRRGRVVFDAWWGFTREMAAHFAAADPKARVQWAGPDMSVRSSITARLMETWAHGQEVYDVLGAERVDGDRIRSIADLGVRTFGWTFANRGLPPPGDPPHVRLRGPSGALWTWHEPSETDLVEGSASEFCQVVTQVRSLADTKLRVVGGSATRWMAIAQCFAGPVSDPPAPGTRFRQG